MSKKRDALGKLSVLRTGYGMTERLLLYIVWALRSPSNPPAQQVAPDHAAVASTNKE